MKAPSCSSTLFFDDEALPIQLADWIRVRTQPADPGFRYRQEGSLPATISKSPDTGQKTGQMTGPELAPIQPSCLLYWFL